MSIRTRLRRLGDRTDDVIDTMLGCPPEPDLPEPTITGTGDYQLYHSASILTAQTIQRFPSLADAMNAAKYPNPDVWYYLGVGAITVKHEYRRGTDCCIQSPHIGAELQAMRDEKRRVEEEERAERSRQAAAAWRREDAEKRAKREAEEAAKPRPVAPSFLTRAGEALRRQDLAVAVTKPNNSSAVTATCHGCGETEVSDRYYSSNGDIEEAARWARKHAAECRAVPAGGDDA
jgi:hypothetical protein